eukprot:1332072-Amphidinium_carterae.1
MQTGAHPQPPSSKTTQPNVRHNVPLLASCVICVPVFFLFWGTFGARVVVHLSVPMENNPDS